MTTIEATIDVAVPAQTAYDQWTHFELLPKWMNGVQQVSPGTDRTLHWETRIAGVRRGFDAEITAQQPPQRVAWRTVRGTRHEGEVSFQRLDEGRTRLRVRIDYHPATLAERAGAMTGLVDRRVRHDLELFKVHVETRAEVAGQGGAPLAPRGGTSRRSFPPGGVAGAPGAAATRPHDQDNGSTDRGASTDEPR